MTGVVVYLDRRRASRWPCGLKQVWVARQYQTAYEGEGRSRVAALRDLRPVEERNS